VRVDFGMLRLSNMRLLAVPVDPLKPFIPVFVESPGPANLLGFAMNDVVVQMQGVKGPGVGYQLSACQINSVDLWSIVNCGFQCDGPLTDGVAVARKASMGVIDRCVVKGSSKAAFYFAEARECVLRHSWARDTNAKVNQYGAGLVFANSQDIIVDGLFVNGVRGAAAKKGNGVMFIQGQLSTVRSVQVKNLRVQGADEFGAWVAGGARDVKITGQVSVGAGGALHPSQVDAGSVADVLDLVGV
jgi:hypothetical protein